MSEGEVSRRPKMVFRRPINFKKVFHRPEMVSRRSTNFKKFPVDQKWFPGDLLI